MKKGGKKYIIYVVSNSYVSSSFYLKVVSQLMCLHATRRVIKKKVITICSN